MKVFEFEAEDFLARENRIHIVFNTDLNIMTGRNGSGKTSVLKLIWYIMSGNILEALKEVPFSRARLVTDLYEVQVIRTGTNACKISLNAEGKSRLFEDQGDDEFVYENAEDLAREHIVKFGRSIFLPTFRRIEGGFTLGQKSSSNALSPFSNSNSARERSGVEDGLIDLSRRLTRSQHRFVASISTLDVVNLLVSSYSDISAKNNQRQQAVSGEIIRDIKFYRSQSHAETSVVVDSLLDEISDKIVKMEEQRDISLTPFSEITSLVRELFVHSGISISKTINFGEAANAVSSDSLSAGEKQMLSFLCYNAFITNGVVIIDEPELSLHVDWQRQLFPILQQQQSTNQFIVATHSPFIYSKYPDKELNVNTDRGYREG